MENKFARQRNMELLNLIDLFSRCSDLDNLLETAFQNICTRPQVNFVSVVYFNEAMIVPLGYAYRSELGNKINIYIDSWLLDMNYGKSIMKMRYSRTHRALPILLNDGTENIGLLYIGLNLETISIQLLGELDILARILAIKLRSLLLKRKEEELKREVERINANNKENIRFLCDVSKQLYAITAVSTRIGETFSCSSFFKKIESKIRTIFSCDAMVVFWGSEWARGAKSVFKSANIRNADFRTIMAQILQRKIMDDKKPFQIDFSLADSVDARDKGNKFKKLIISPLSIKTQVKGYLVLAHKDHKDYVNDTMRLLSGISSMLATAIENMILYEQTRRERAKLRFLLDSISHFSDTLDLGDTLKSIVKAAANTLGTKGTVFLLSRSKVPLVVFSKISQQMENTSIHEKIEESTLRYLLRHFERTKRAMLIGDIKHTQKIPLPIVKSLKCWDIHSVLGVPLKLKGEQLGVLLICSGDKKKRFSDEDLELAKGLADAAAVSIRNSQIYSSAQELSFFLEKKIIEGKTVLEAAGNKQARDLENTELLIFRLNLKGCFVFVNRTMEIKTGYDKRLFYSGRVSPLDLVMPENRVRLKGMIKSVLNGNVDRIENAELAIFNSRNEKIILNMNIYPDKDANGRIVGLEAVCEDITVKKMVEEELTKSKELALLGEFSGAIAHQVRNPLSQIYVALRRMQMSLQGELSEFFNNAYTATGFDEFSRILGDALENTRHLARMINDVLSYTKTLQICVTNQSLEQIVREAIEDFVPIASERNIVMTIEKLNEIPYAYVDAVLLGQTFRNIIQNSIEAMEEGGKLSVILSVVQGQNSKYARIAFKDTGKGIPKDCVDKIFRPFFTTKAQGTGLGLSFASRVIAAHKGSIWAESDGTNGATIFLLLPLENDACRE